MSRSSYISNAFMTPNAIIDELMPLLTDSEFRVLMFMVRQILGWQKNNETKRAVIAQSVMENGYSYQDKKGENHEILGCGIGCKAISNALKALQKYRIVKKIGKSSSRGQEWELSLMTEDNPDIEGLKLRQKNKADKSKKQMAKARKKMIENREKEETLVVQLPQSDPSSSTTIDPSSSTTIDPSSSTTNNYIHKEIHEEIHSSAPGAKNTPSGEKKQSSTKERDRIFDGIAFICFGLDTKSDNPDVKNLVKSSGGRIGKIVSWLKALEEKTSPEELWRFHSSYKDKYKDAPLPRDVGKFSEHFLEFRQCGIKQEHAAKSQLRSVTETAAMMAEVRNFVDPILDVPQAVDKPPEVENPEDEEAA